MTCVHPLVSIFGNDHLLEEAGHYVSNHRDSCPVSATVSNAANRRDAVCVFFGVFDGEQSFDLLV